MEEKVIHFKMKFTKKEEKELDELWAKKVKDRDKWTCQICVERIHGRNCHAHHILPRQLKEKRIGLRWDVDNGITLCYNHHKRGVWSAHNNAIWFTFWLKTNKPTQFKHTIEKLKKLGKEI